MMPLSEILFFGVVFYLAYRFIFNFFLPVFRTTRHIRQQFRNMQDPSMNDQSNPFQQSASAQGRAQPNSPNGTQQGRAQQNATQSGKAGAATTPKNSMGEYIDFEEIK
jgi:hypothetical protein